MGCVPRNNYGDLSKKQAYKCKEKFVIVQSIRIIVIKSKETKVAPTSADILVGI